MAYTDKAIRKKLKLKALQIEMAGKNAAQQPATDSKTK